MHHGKSYFFVGIGGSGMMPLAMILAGQGATVAGSDRSLDSGRLPAKFDDLKRRGIALFPQDGSGITSPDQIVVASAAIEETVPDMVRAAELGNARMTRAELLAQLFNAASQSIGVAGTSGKSTVTGMIGWILHALGRDPTVMNGAVMKNFARPRRPSRARWWARAKRSSAKSTRATDRSRLYWPKVAVLNNVSLDHKSPMEIARIVRRVHRQGGQRGGQSRQWRRRGAGDDAACGPADHFAIESEADLIAGNIEQQRFGVAFDLVTRGRSAGPGDAAGAGPPQCLERAGRIGAARAAGVPLDEAVRAIEGFAGLKRRFELVGEAGGVAVIDDFGHNPDKIAATLDTLHAFPGRLLLLFQPHGYGPLKVMRSELVAMFAEKLAATTC
jgi:UDP-N-acetylmuramate--alanine ligase